MNATLPECLTRRAADDRAEAEKRAAADMPKSFRSRLHTNTGAFDAALAQVQHEQATAVFDAAHRALGTHALHDEPARRLQDEAFGVALLAMDATKEPKWFSSERRTKLLDHARGLVALAIEVAG